MKNILVVIILFILSVSAALADTDAILNNLSEKISEGAAKLIPGDGLTEVSIEIKEHQEPDFTILAVRDLQKTDRSNFFTQFSFHNNDVGGDERYIGNFGLGYRVLSPDESNMFGINVFYDKDLVVHHQRLSMGLEARASVLEFSTNYYDGLTNEQTVSGTDELAVSGYDSKLTTQIPHMPWTKFSWTGYVHKAGEASKDTEGDIFGLELYLMPALQMDLSRDISNHSDGNEYAATLNFIYPPQEDKKTLVDGFTSDEIWHKASMASHLSDKVQRNNNLTVEVQGAVIITSK